MKAIKMFWQVIENDLFLSLCAYALVGFFLGIFILFVLSVFQEVANWEEEARV